MYQKVVERDFMFFWQKEITKLVEFKLLETGVYPSSTHIVEAMKTLLNQWHKHAENCIKVTLYQRMQKLRFTLQRRLLELHSLLPTWDTLLEVMLAMNLSWYWVEQDLTNQNLLTKLFAFIFSFFLNLIE